MLGFILAPLGQEVAGQYPNEIGYSYGGNGQFLCPFDPQFNQNGEQGLYFDTQLGDIPTDAELSTAYGYTPEVSGWIAAQEGYFTGPWVPPGGWNPAGAYGPPVAPRKPLGALSGATAISFSTIATAVIAIAAIFNSYHTWKRLQQDEAKLKQRGLLARAR